MTTLLYFILFVTVIVCTSGVKEKIYGGKPAKITSAPYMAILRFKFSNEIRCGASIVHPQFLVTAAHCIETYEKYFRITVGTDSLKKGGEDYQIEKIDIHPKYSAEDSYTYDVAVIKLKKKLTLNARVLPIPLVNDDMRLEDGAMVDSFGFGRMENGKSSQHLLKVSLPIFDHAVCKDLHYNYDSSYEHIINESMICAGGQEGEDTCEGDSGGPLVYNNRLVGVVSWGINCSLPGYPGVYASIAASRDFIDAAISDNL